MKSAHAARLSPRSAGFEWIRFAASIPVFGAACAAFAFLSGAAVNNAALAQQTFPGAQLTSVYPAGGKIGSSFDVTVAGVDLDEAVRLNFNHPGITSQLKTEALPDLPGMAGMGKGGRAKRPRQQRAFTVTVANDVPTGLYDVRLVGKFGISNPRAFQISGQNEFNSTDPNATLAQANAVSLETTINGRSKAENSDFFKFTAKQGQRVLINCWSRRLDSRMNGSLVLLDAKGRELASSHEVNRRDPMIDFSVPADGDYVLRVHDFLYRGGDEYFYRVSLSTAPYVDFVFPNAGLPGNKSEYTLYGRNLPNGTASDVKSLDGKPLDQLKMQIELPSDPVVQRQLPITDCVEPQDSGMDGFAYRVTNSQGQQSNTVLIGYATAPVVLEQEPNNEPSQAQKLNVPCEVIGQFNPRGDQDWYTFDAKKGEVYWLDCVSERLGLPTDPYMLIQRVKKDDKGVETVSEVAEVDDAKAVNKGDGAQGMAADYETSTNDPTYKLIVGEDSTYRVLIRDLYYGSRGNARFIYRLAIRHESPDFRLVAVADPPNDDRNGGNARLWTPYLHKGGASPLKVYAFRRDDFKGDIELSVEGLPAGVKCPPVVVGTGMPVATLVFTADENAAPWAGSIKVIGKAKIGDADVTREARGGSIIWSVANRQNENPRSRMTSDIALAVSGDEMESVTIDAGEGKVWETSLGGKLQIPVKITRRNDFKANVQLTSPGLPNNIKPANLDIPADKTEGVLNFDVKQGALPGTYSFALHAATQLANYRRDPVGAQAAADFSKEMEKIATDLATAAKQTLDQLTAANKTLADAQAAQKAAVAKQAAAKTAVDQKKDDAALVEAAAAADKAVTEANDKLKAATDGQVAATTASNDAAAKSKMAETEKNTAKQRAAETAESSKPKQINAVYISTPIVVKIVSAPVTIDQPSAPGALKQGQKIEVPISVQRLYGFTDAVEITLQPAPGTNGIKAAQINIPKDQTSGKLMVEADPKASLGDLQLTIKAKVNFNGQQLTADQTLPLKVEVADAK